MILVKEFKSTNINLKKSTKKVNAFTLIELLAVIIIIAIIAVITIPKINEVLENSRKEQHKIQHMDIQEQLINII